MTASTPSVDDRIPVILDVDTGVDDAYALMLAVRSPLVELRAVTCVAGNAGLSKVLANTRHVLDVTGAGDIPIGPGATGPLLSVRHEAGHVHGWDGLGGFARRSDRPLSGLSAIDLLRQTLMAAIGNGETITLVPLGPQTNIALLLRAHPEVAPGIERIVFMGGSASCGNVTPVAEFNVYADPEATAITLAAAGELDIPITMYGLDVFNDVLVDLADADRLLASGDPAAQLAGRLIQFHASTFEADEVTIGDAGTLCAVIDPGGLATDRLSVTVDTAPGFGRGQTIVDRRPWLGETDPVRAPRSGTRTDVALGVEGERYRDLWLSAFRL